MPPLTESIIVKIVPVAIVRKTVMWKVTIFNNQWIAQRTFKQLNVADSKIASEHRRERERKYGGESGKQVNSPFECCHYPLNSATTASLHRWKGQKNVCIGINSVSSAIKIKLAAAVRHFDKMVEYYPDTRLQVIFFAIFIKSHLLLHTLRFNAWLVHIEIFQNRLFYGCTESKPMHLWAKSTLFGRRERERQRKMNKFQNLLKMVKFANHLAILAFFLSFISTNQPFPLEMSARFFFLSSSILCIVYFRVLYRNVFPSLQLFFFPFRPVHVYLCSLLSFVSYAFI